MGSWTLCSSVSRWSTGRALRVYPMSGSGSSNNFVPTCRLLSLVANSTYADQTRRPLRPSLDNIHPAHSSRSKLQSAKHLNRVMQLDPRLSHLLRLPRRITVAALDDRKWQGQQRQARLEQIPKKVEKDKWMAQIRYRVRRLGVAMRKEEET